MNTASKKDKSPEHRFVYDAILNGNPPLEVSTGYFVIDPIQNQGEYEGEEFTAVQTSIMPNHFAILYGDEIGAFSREMGGGVHVNKRVGKHRAINTGAKTIRTGYRSAIDFKDTWAIKGDKKGAVFAQQRNGKWATYTPSKRIDKKVFGHYDRGYKANSLYGAVRRHLKGNGKKHLKHFIRNAQSTQLMISELLLQKIKQAHPDVKKVTEIYHDTEDGKNYAVFERNKQVYKVAYDFEPNKGVTIGNYATPVTAARMYTDIAPKSNLKRFKRASNGREMTLDDKGKCKRVKKKA